MDLEFNNIIDADEELIEKIRTWRNSKQVSKYMYTNHQITKKEHQKWIGKFKKQNNKKAWVIIYKNKPVGLIQLSDIDYKNKAVEWGFYIADETLHGKGIGSASLYKLIEYVFDIMKFDKIRTITLENNIKAVKLYKKFGFKTVLIKDKLQRDYKIINVFLMELDKQKWSTVNKNLKKTIVLNIGNIEI